MIPRSIHVTRGVRRSGILFKGQLLRCAQGVDLIGPHSAKLFGCFACFCFQNVYCAAPEFHSDFALGCGAVSNASVRGSRWDHMCQQATLQCWLNGSAATAGLRSWLCEKTLFVSCRLSRRCSVLFFCSWIAKVVSLITHPPVRGCHALAVDIAREGRTLVREEPWTTDCWQ